MKNVGSGPKKPISLGRPEQIQQGPGERRDTRSMNAGSTPSSTSDVISTSSSRSSTFFLPEPPGTPLSSKAASVGLKSAPTPDSSIKAWFKKVETMTLEAQVEHNKGGLVLPLSLPRNEAWFQYLCPQPSMAIKAERHIRMMLPEPGPVAEKEIPLGTWEVAGWISESIKQAISESNQGGSTPCPFESLGISIGRLNDVKHALNRVTSHLDFLQEIRDLTRFASVLHVTNKGTENDWALFYHHCFFSVCSQLRTGGTALLPSDHTNLAAKRGVAARFKTNNLEAGDLESHAMTAILQKTSWSDTCNVFHLETNGSNSRKIKWKAVEAKRKLLSRSSTLDRSILLSPYDFPETDDYRQTKNKTKTPKTFVLSEGKYNLSLVHNEVLNLSKADTSDEVLFVRDLLCINYEHGYHNYENTVSLRKDLMGEISASGKFMQPVQRMHAIQLTGSCELKSTTTAACFLLGGDELAYQALMGIIFDKAVREYRAYPDNDYSPLTASFPAERELLLKRIRDASILTDERFRPRS